MTLRRDQPPVLAWSDEDVCLPVRPDWHQRAACRHTDIDMFPTTQAGLDAAVAVCAGCPVIVDCHTAGIDEDHGVWGGVPHGPGHDRCDCGRWIIRRRHASATTRCTTCQAVVKRQQWAAASQRRRDRGVA